MRHDDIQSIIKQNYKPKSEPDQNNTPSYSLLSNAIIRDYAANMIHSND